MSDSDSSPPPLEFAVKEKPSTTVQDDSSTGKTTTVELEPSDIHLSIIAMQLARARMKLVEQGLQTPEQQAKQVEKQTQVVRRLSIVQDQLEKAKK